MTMIYFKDLIAKAITGDKYIISPDFQIVDMDHVVQLENFYSTYLKEMSIISNKGYINDSEVDIPYVKDFLNSFNSPISESSISINIMYYHLILLIVLSIVVQMELFIDKSKNENIFYKSINITDVEADVLVLKNNILRMIHPVIKERLSNKGISITLNTFSGFDSEYELESSLNKTNKLISIQLAVNTGMYVKVPIIGKKSLTVSDITIHGIKSRELSLSKMCIKSMESLIADIRSILHKENDQLIEELILSMNKKDLIKIEIPDYIIYTYPKTSVETIIKYTKIDGVKYDETDIIIKEYNSVDLIKDSDSIKNKELEKSLLSFINILNDLTDSTNTDKMLGKVIECSNKQSSRISYGFKGKKLSISIKRLLYINMHESAADLSMLSDFESFKESFDIVGRSFVTRSKPLTLDYSKSRVHFRDNVLIAPAGFASLDKIGGIYGPEYRKIDIGEYRNGRMRDLLKENKPLFDDYALRDSITTLKHAVSMEEYYVSIGKQGVPLTLSGIAKSYVHLEWAKNGYIGYQVRKDLLLGNFTSVLTPKTARSLEISRFLVPYITSYRGGRNESFMYGIDTIKDSKTWYDYDLTSAYTTVMSILGHPDYKKARRIFNKTVLEMKSTDFLFNYIVLEVDFVFPEGTKYPSIPTRVDDDVDIYPLEGKSIITGCEYLTAKSMGCRIYVRDGVIIPFLGVSKNTKPKTKDYTYNIQYKTPFRNIIKELQSKRRAYPAKTFYNLLYKTIGNSVYGQVSMGISGKKSFDIKTNSYLQVSGGDLSNPILASYITGFARSLIGECLNNVMLLNGSVISVTTDGFITDISDLEDKILGLSDINTPCLKLYRDIRRLLTTFDDVNVFDASGLEVKNVETLGIISWKTRGQLGFTDGGISAATGFQAKFLDKSFLIEEISRILKDQGDKTVDFTQTGLRSATDIYQKGGCLIAKYKDQKYSFYYDNKRQVVDNGGGMLRENGDVCLLDTKPWKTVEEYARIRILNKTVKNPIFSNGFPTQQGNTYNSYIETGVRGFIKACLSSNRYGVPSKAFDSYKSIIDFVHGFELARQVKLSVKNISNLKNRNTIMRAVPRTLENELFVDYVKKHFDTFDSDRFFRELSPELVRNKKRKGKVV